MNLSRFFLLFYLSICIPLMAIDLTAIKDQVIDTVSQGATYVNSIVIAHPIAAVIPEDRIIHLILIGKTGAGKSTFINSFYNLASGTQWNDFPKKFPICTKFQPCNVEQYEVKSKLIENLEGESLASATQEPSEYIVQNKSFVIKLIDSPGAADTRGIEQDMLNTEKIANFIARAGQFNAICIVLPITANRATKEENYLIEQLKTIIPKSANNRIFILVSYASFPNSEVGNYIKSFELPTENIFYFDNFAFSKDGHIDLRNINLEKQPTKSDEVEEDFFSEKIQEPTNFDMEIALKIKDCWSKAEKEFRKLIVKAKELGKHSTDEMKQISKIKAKVTEKIFNAYRHIEALEKTEIQAKKVQELLKSAEEEYNRSLSIKTNAEKEALAAEAEKKAAEILDSYEIYTEKELYSTDSHNTICMHCGVACHIKCGLEYKGDNYLDHLHACKCMNNGRCTACQCSYNLHRHRRASYRDVSKKREDKVTIERKINAEKQREEYQKILDETKKELNKKIIVKRNLKGSVKNINCLLDQLKAQKEILQDEIVKLYFKLSQVSMASINFHIADYYDTIIKKEADIVKKEKLTKDRKFYTELVEKYKQKQQSLPQQQQ